MMQSQCCDREVTFQTTVDDSKRGAGWLAGRRGVYTELPDPFGHQIGGATAVVGSQLAPTEGFSFAPGWSLNADHFYQWQHRGKTTQQVAFVAFGHTRTCEMSLIEVLRILKYIVDQASRDMRVSRLKRLKKLSQVVI